MGDSIHLPTMVSIKDAADQTGLSPYYLRQLCRSGRVRYVVAGHRWLVNLDSLAVYFEHGDPAGR